MRKLFTTLSYITLLVAAFLIALTGYWLLYPYKVFEVKDIRVLTPQVKAGQEVHYQTTACKYMDIPGEVNKILVDSVFIPYPPYEAQTFTGCKTTELTNSVPSFVSAGKYYINITVTYKVNPIRTISVTYKTPIFEVIK